MTGLIAAHQSLLARWRKAMDLVGPGPIEPHFQDAEGAVDGLAATGRWADLGSGAGFPGIALAARYPEVEVLLVESRLKRAVFLEKVVAQGGPGLARVVHGRTEDLEDASFDGVISRAYKPPPAFLEDARRLLVPTGRAVVLTGDSELEVPPGWELLESIRYAVGKGFRRRFVVAWRG